MKLIRVLMARADLKEIPEHPLPEGFHLRLFQEGDQIEWARVEAAAGEFASEEKAMEQFNQEFAQHLDEFAKRCVFIEDENGKVIGTTTAWYGSREEAGDIIGRIHWVSLIPEYQGQGLAKPLLTAAMEILEKYHTEAYLTSQTTSYKAINMYQQYGFKRVIRNEQDEEAWEIVDEALR